MTGGIDSLRAAQDKVDRQIRATIAAGADLDTLRTLALAWTELARKIAAVAP